jgi:diketogulonate reductase-like aldo/keto reductase
MTTPDHQLHLFSPIKKAITKERIEEAKRLMAQRTTKDQVKGLRDLNEMLEIVERRIVNKK